MSYNNEQFFKIGNTEPGSTSKGDRGGPGWVANNPPFVYPSNVIRTVEDDRHRGNQLRNQNQRPNVRVLQRGYIRSLVTQIEDQKVKVAKCQFQFNPTTLNQTVQANESFRSYLHEDPALYSVPTPGTSNFQFTIIFDRSMEMNNSDTVLGKNFDALNPWELSDPGQVGVLRDIAAFNAAIGQGMSADQADYQAAVFRRGINAEALFADEDPSLDADAVASQLPTFLEMNVGNNAFLTPLPVRVVFSSLYMVDGFVKSTDVSFTKFNSAYVPMQCALSVQMEAKYIGFAKPKTFLTDSLDRTLQAWEAKEAAVAAEVKSYNDAFQASMGTVRVAADLGRTSSYPPNNSLATILKADSVSLSVFGSFDHITPWVNGLNNTASTPIASLYQDGSAMTIYSQAEIDVHGPFTAAEAATFTTPASRKAASTTDNLLRSMVVGPHDSENVLAKTEGEWDDMKKVFHNENLRTSAKDSPTSLSDSVIDSSYFIVRWKGYTSVQFNGTRATGVGEDWTLTNLGAPGLLQKTVVLDWTGGEALTTGTTVPAVPSENAAVTAPPPGATSDVGKLRDTRNTTGSNVAV